MKKFSLYFVLIVLLASGCGDNENELSPSGMERNWLVLEDSPNDEIDHLRYLIFQETGVPIYYNDTVGSESRYSLSAKEYYTYYEVLQVFYTPGGKNPSKLVADYKLVEDREKVKPVLEFLQKEVLPDIPASVYIPSVLLVDSMKTPSGDSIGYKGFNTYLLGGVKEFGQMDENTKKMYRGTFLAMTIAINLCESESEWLEEKFYGLTYAVNPTNIAKMYSIDKTDVYVYTACGGMPLKPEEQTLAVIGFIGTRKTPPAGQAERLWTVPLKRQDVQQYCQALFTNTQEEFVKKHGDAPVVMAKYRVMREKLESYGFVLD